MAHFLRDEKIANLTLDEKRLRLLDAAFRSRAAALDATQPQPNVIVFDVIRFDRKGYRVFSLDDLLRYFLTAGDVERVIFQLETPESLRTSRLTGAYAELRLDAREANNCFLTVSADSNDWVDATFSAVKEVLSQCKNRSGLVRNVWSQLVIQVVGVVVGFLLSLWAATRIAPHLSIENSFLIAFLFVLFLFSNLWAHANQRLLGVVASTFPNIKFFRPGRETMHWLAQTVVGSLIVAIVLFLLAKGLDLLGRELGKLVSSG